MSCQPYLAITTCLCAVLSAGADMLPFPNADGSFDLASSEAWGATFPGLSDVVQLNDKDATYDVSKDLSIAQIYFNRSGQTIDLSGHSDVTVTLSGSTGIYPYSNGNSLSLVGGKYYFENKGMLVVTSTGWGTNPNNHMQLSGGVVVTNVGNVRLRYSGTSVASPSLSLSGAGTVLDAMGFVDNYSGPVAYSYTGDPTEEGVGLDISGGARFTIHYASGYDYFKPSGVTIVRGEGSVLESTTSYSYIGLVRAGTIVHVTDKGTFKAATLLIPNNDNSNNHLYVDDGGTAQFSVVYIGGWGTSGADNWLEVAPGGSVDVGTQLYMAGTNNHVVVSNGTLHVGTSSMIGKNPTDRGHELKVYGPGAMIDDPSLFYIFAAGSGHRFTIGGGASVSIAKSTYISNGTTDADGTNTAHTVEILDGSRLDITGNFNFRSYDSTVAANGNTLRIASGGEMTCTRMVLRCVENSIVISNGTLCCSDASQSLLCGGDENNGKGHVVSARGNRIVFEGEMPRLYGPGQASISDDSTLVFRPSTNGFTTTSALMSFSTISIDSSTSLVFEGIDELRKSLKKSKTFILLEATGDTGAVGLSDAKIAAANATLPEMCALSMSSNRKRLLLKVTALRGSTIYIR